MSEAESVLLYLAGRHYTLEEIARMVGRERMIQSSVWNGGRDEGLNEGRGQGRLEAAREFCISMTEKYHAALAPLALATIQACTDPAQLQRWVVSAPDLDDEAYARLLSIDRR
jgi:hypothetical protein